MVNVKTFESLSEFNLEKDSLELPYVADIPGEMVIYSSHKNWVGHNKSKKKLGLCPYLKFTALEDNSIVILDSYDSGSIVSLNNTLTLYYSTDGETFNSWDGSISLNKDDYVYILGRNQTSWVNGSYYPHFSMTGKIAASGNIMSLINSYCPTTIPFERAFEYMFYGCTSLITAPKLPATTLNPYCYSGMFQGCTSLTTAPKLPAIALPQYCYYEMFRSCTSLITVSELPATTLAPNCYSGMFQGCTSLVTAPKLPATTLAPNCYNSMFRSCTSLTTAPALPATMLVNRCYCRMFRSCQKLNYIKALFTTTPNNTYTSEWLLDVSSTGTFVKNAAATWDVSGALGIPSGWTVQTATS